MPNHHGCVRKKLWISYIFAMEKIESIQWLVNLTNPISGSNTMKYATNPLRTIINGTVTKVQNGQQGPATTIGLPSRFSNKKNIVPTLLAQQQKYL